MIKTIRHNNHELNQTMTSPHNFEGLTPLMIACQHGRFEDVKKIIQKAPSSVTQLTRSEKLPLHFCAEGGHTECTELVLNTNPKLLNHKDEEGYTPIHLAVINGNKNIVKLFISNRADLTCLDNEKHSLVHWATVCGELEILDILLSNKSPATTPDIHLAHPIHYAAQLCGNVDKNNSYSVSPRKGLLILNRLIQHGVPIDVKDQDGRQALLWAASAGSSDAILCLLNAGARVEAEDKDGLTALHCSASRGHTNCIETLIALCGAEVDVIDKNGCSPLFYSVTLGHADCTELLLNYGAEPNRQDRKGRTPAHCGCSKGQLETIKIFKKHGGDLWMKNIRGDLPLHEAVISGRKDLVVWLLGEKMESVNYGNNDGRTSLHLASIGDNVEIVKILLDNGADINPLMRTGKGIMMTPLDAAIYKGNSSVAKFLQLHGGLPSNLLNDTTLIKRKKALSRTLDDTPHRSTSNINGKYSGSNDTQHGISSTDYYPSPDILDISLTRQYTHSVSGMIIKETSQSRMVTSTPINGQRSIEVQVGDHFNERNEEVLVAGDHPVVSAHSKKSTSSDKKLRRKRSSTRETLKNNSHSTDDSSDSPANNISRRTNKTSGKLGAEPTDVKKDIPRTTSQMSYTENYESEKFSELEIVQHSSDSEIYKEDFGKSNEINKTLEEPSNELKNEHLDSTLDLSEEGPITGDIDKRVSNVNSPLETVRPLSTKSRSSSAGSHIANKSRGSSPRSKSIPSRPVSTTRQSRPPSTNGKRKSRESSAKSNRAPSTNPNVEENVDQTYETISNRIANDIISEIEYINVGSENTNGREMVGAEAATQNSGDQNIVTEQKSTESTTTGSSDTTTSTTTTEQKLDETSTESTTEIQHDNLHDQTSTDSTTIELLDDSIIHENLLNQVTLQEAASKRKKSNHTLPKRSIKKPAPPLNSYYLKTPKGSPKSKLESSSAGSSVKSGKKSIKTDEDLDEIKLQEELLAMRRHQVMSSKSKIPTSKSNGHQYITNNIEVPSRKRNESENSNQGVIRDSGYSEIIPTSASEDHHVKKSNGSIRRRVLSKRPKSGNAISKKKLGLTHSSAQQQRNESGDSTPIGGSATSDDSKRNRKVRPRSKLTFSKGEENVKSPNPRKQIDIVTPISVTQAMQASMRKYHLERKIFNELLELKRLQIRASKANEQVLVKRLSDGYMKQGLSINNKDYHGPFTFSNFEKYLYDQLRLLQLNRRILPHFSPSDDLEKLSQALKKMNATKLPYIESDCTESTHRCHHAAHAYTGIPCAAYIGKRNTPTFLPRVNPLKSPGPRQDDIINRLNQSSSNRELNSAPITLEIQQGSTSKIFTLPNETLDPMKNYYVSLSIKPSPSPTKMMEGNIEVVDGAQQEGHQIIRNAESRLPNSNNLNDSGHNLSI